MIEETKIKLKDFTLEVEYFLSKHNDVSPIDAVIFMAEKYGLEMETVGKLVKGPLKDKILIDAKNHRLMKDNEVEENLYEYF